MKKVFFLSIMLMFTVVVIKAQPRYFDFQTAAPESLNLNPVILQEHVDELFRRGTQAYMVVYKDKVVCERYAPDWNRYRPHGTASAAKALIGGLSLMLAMHDGFITSLDDPAWKYIPEWKNDPIKSKITLRMLGAHTSGLDDTTERGYSDNMTIPGWKGDFWRQERSPFLIARDETPVIFAPGTAEQYSNPGIGMFNYVVAAAIKDNEHSDIRTYLWERLLKKMGIPQEEWIVGYGKTFELDGLKLVATWGGGTVSTRAAAAVGRLLVNKGSWNGEQLLNVKVVEAVLKHSGTPSYCSFGFWLNTDIAGKVRWPDMPWDAAMASGRRDQVMIFSPTRDLIIVRFGDDNIGQGRNDANPINKYIGLPLANAISDIAPYPRSEKITDMQWAPASTIVRLATGEATKDGSDNWPMTWAQDDCLYTAYGDGYGFEPSLPQKLGMGFAKVMGNPDDFTYENIRSDAENSGYGVRGQKASGQLAIDNSIYLWVRNDDLNGSKSRLARSNNRQKTWTWCDWRFEEFGHIAFVNYGKNYEGARDNYVYMVSHDNPSAYAVSDHFVLLRAPKDQLMDRGKYEFYKGLDKNGAPLWTSDVRQRQPVFTNPKNCRRSSISYNAGIGRYLWWQQMSSTGENDTRYIGGIGIYEAPEPWGPWTTVYYSEKWDVGPGDLACFPTKWISEDGKTMYLVFSGNDNFSLRKVTLIISDK